MNRLLLMTAFIAVTSFNASANTLSGTEIEGLITGKQVSLATSWGTFPLRYSGNKSVTGDGTGLGLAKFFAPKETGQWWVKGNQLCQQFPTWYKGKPLCFTIQKTGISTIRWTREDGYSGTATIRE